MTLYGWLVLMSIYLGFSAAHTFGLVGIEVFGVIALICAWLIGVAEYSK